MAIESHTNSLLMALLKPVLIDFSQLNKAIEEKDNLRRACHTKAHDQSSKRQSIRSLMDLIL